MKILLVDDNTIVRGLTREMLESAGYDVVEANGLAHAVDRARELGDVEVLVTDLVLYSSAFADLDWTGSFVPKQYTSAELFESLDRPVLLQ